ncbi:Hpt domain-containing protein [Sinomonas halotolerans]|uniref:Hpt domain-containing protein n=1 Tax=Sinomonas halotolerans TaxID=1644133 RepID=A0ABU9X1F1_9MICC
MPALDPERIAVLRELGPADGQGLLPATAEAFRHEAEWGLRDLRAAAADGGGEPLFRAAHRLRGSAANIGASRVADLCAELEAAGRSGGAPGEDALDRLEAELSRVDEELDRIQEDLGQVQEEGQ